MLDAHMNVPRGCRTVSGNAVAEKPRSTGAQIGQVEFRLTVGPPQLRRFSHAPRFGVPNVSQVSGAAICRCKAQRLIRDFRFFLAVAEFSKVKR